MTTKFDIHKIITQRVALRQFIESDRKKRASIKIFAKEQDVTSEFIGMHINRKIYEL